MEYYILLAIVAAIAGVGVGQKWKNIITGLAGKQIAILGANAAGKTTLFTFLEMLPHDSIKATRIPKKTDIGEIQLKYGKNVVYFRCKSSKDTPGDTENRNLYWKELLQNSDSVLYLVHASRLLKGEEEEIQKEIEMVQNKFKGKQLEVELEKINNEKKRRKQETENRVKEDLEFINNKLNNNVNKVIIIGNHFDEVDTNFSDKIAHYQNEFINNKIIKESGKRMDKTIGSFKDGKGVEKVMEDVYTIIKAKEEPIIKKIKYLFREK